MFKSFRSAICAIAVATVAVGVPLAVLAAPAGASAGANSGNASICNQGGYQVVQGNDGTQFENVGQCVSYAAQGGVLAVTIAAENECEFFGGTFGVTNEIPFLQYDEVIFTCNRIPFPNSSGEQGFEMVDNLAKFCPVAKSEQAAGAFVDGNTAVDYTCGTPGTFLTP
jgi:hypothetical protein